MSIHYGLGEEVSAAEFDDSALKSDLSALKSDLAAEKLKVSANKTNVALNKAAITAEKTKLGNTRTLLSNLSGQVTTVENNVATEKARITTNAGKISTNTTKISALESKAETNRLGILNTFTSIVNYHVRISDLYKNYKTMENYPNSHWPPLLIQFGSIDTKTTFRLVGIVCDEDVVLPSANFSVTFLLKAYTAIGEIAEAEVATLNLSTFQIPNKPYFCINRDYNLRTLFPTQTIKCGQLYMKHNMGNQNITVELIVTCAIVQF